CGDSVHRPVPSRADGNRRRQCRRPRLSDRHRPYAAGRRRAVHLPASQWDGRGLQLGRERSENQASRGPIGSEGDFSITFSPRPHSRPSETPLHPHIANLAERVLAGHLLTREEASTLTRIGGEDVYDLFYWANKIRVKFMGRDVKFCAIVAAKVGGCSEDCKFCAQSAHYDGPAREQSQLADEQVLQSAWHAAEVGADSFGIVNSGRGPTRRELEDWLKPIMMKIATEG